MVRASRPAYALPLVVASVVAIPILGALLGLLAGRSGFHPLSRYWSLLALIAMLPNIIHKLSGGRVGPSWSEPGLTRSKLAVMALSLLMMLYIFFLLGARFA